MDTLAELISLLNNADEVDFKNFLKRKNKRDDAKNIDLFDLIKTDDINKKKRLYRSAKSDDAYHALRKRLHDNLLLYLSQKTFETNNNEMYDALRLLVVGRFLLENDLAKLAFKCLDRAERLATALEQFSLVHDILLLKLQYAHLSYAKPLLDLSERLLANQDHMQQEAKLHLAYAFLRQELREINLKGKVVDLTVLILSTIRRYKIVPSEIMTYKSLYQILYIANEYAAIHQNYAMVQRFVKRSYDFIRRHDHPHRHDLFYHISIVYFLANIHLRNKKFVESQRYLEQMTLLMNGEVQLARSFFMRQQLLLALNQYYAGKGEAAITIVTETLTAARKNAKAEDIEDLRSCLVMFLAQHNDRACLQHLRLLTHTDAWYEKKMGMLWTIRKNLMEILVQAQFEHMELAVSRLRAFRRRYKKYLLTTREERVLHFIELVEKYITHPNIVFEASYQKTVLGLLSVEENNDIFNLSFISWLVARWEKKTSYEVTVKLIKQARAHCV